LARKTREELNKLCKELNVKKLDSWSKYHCYKQDHWEAFLKYILHEKEDRTNGIYAVSGGYCHDIIEKFYNDEIEYNGMIDKYEDSLLTMNIAELKYDRNDSEKNEKIANKYENCIRHFFKNHVVINQPHKTEQFITIRICDDIVLQGYIDFLFTEKYTDKNDNEKTRIRIVDWKTSTRYTGQKIDAECGQLVIYAEGIRQTLGIPLEDITCAWNFLKYVTVTYEQKNGKLKDRYIERNSIGESLVNTAKMWLKEFGYEEEIDSYVDSMILDNSIDCLPDEVRNKFTIKDCYVEVPLSEEKIEELKTDIIETLHDFRAKEQEYNKTKDEMIFWQDVTDADAFRLATLSSYSRKLHKPYDAYLKEQEMFEKNNSDNDNEEENSEKVSNNEEDDLLAFLDSL
jgi:hypothetical protein